MDADESIEEQRRFDANQNVMETADPTHGKCPDTGGEIFGAHSGGEWAYRSQEADKERV